MVSTSVFWDNAVSSSCNCCFQAWLSSPMWNELCTCDAGTQVSRDSLLFSCSAEGCLTLPGVAAVAVLRPAAVSQQPKACCIAWCCAWICSYSIYPALLLVIFPTSAFLYNSSLSILLSSILCIHAFQGYINMRTISMPRLLYSIWC